MPLPFILVGAAVAATGVGAKKAYDGYQTKSEAKDITAQADNTYKLTKRGFDKENEQVTKSLDDLGKLQINIGSSFKEFQELADELLQKIESAKHKKLEVSMPKHRLNQIADLSLSATTYLGQLAGGAAAGAAAAYAVYGGVMALAAASTGTPIAALSGAAAYNATLAAIGGGSLAAGGFGMAGGMMVLGATVAAPILAIAGWGYSQHAEKAKENAQKYRREVNEAVLKMEMSIHHLQRVRYYTGRITEELNRIYAVFNTYFDKLKSVGTLVRSGMLDIDALGDQILTTIDNGYQIAAILTDIITTPLFKVKKDNFGRAIMDGKTPEMELDRNGLQILNDIEISEKLAKGSNDYINTVIK